MMTPEEITLWRALHSGDREVRREIFDRYRGLAVAWARRFARRRARHVELADLQQLAFEGLLRAIDQFEPARGRSFRPYASRVIAGRILDGLGVMTEVEQQIAYRSRVRAERARSIAARGQAGPPAEALDILGDLVLGLAIGFMLDRAIIVSAATPDRAASGYERLAWRQMLERLTHEINKLPPQQRTVIEGHYRDELSFETVAALLGVSRSRVSQIHGAALAALRDRIGSDGR
jgi:RNA polymerase sigma factor FliA